MAVLVRCMIEAPCAACLEHQRLVCRPQLRIHRNNFLPVLAACAAHACKAEVLLPFLN